MISDLWVISQFHCHIFNDILIVFSWLKLNHKSGEVMVLVTVFTGFLGSGKTTIILQYVLDSYSSSYSFFNCFNHFQSNDSFIFHISSISSEKKKKKKKKKKKIENWNFNIWFLIDSLIWLQISMLIFIFFLIFNISKIIIKIG